MLATRLRFCSQVQQARKHRNDVHASPLGLQLLRRSHLGMANHPDTLNPARNLSEARETCARGSRSV
jgi:hypothetical protein